MKNNRKNRKLRFIREKNKLRLGITYFCASRKISNHLINDVEAMKYIANGLDKSAKEQLFKKFRILSLINKEFSLAENGDDYIKNCTTLIIKLSNKKTTH